MDINVVSNFSMPAEQERDHKVPHSCTLEDCRSIIILLTLYIVQGIQMGIHLALPIIIYDKLSYSQLGYISLTALPLSMKLLWAPVMETFYSKRLGKRKSWIIPVQLITTVMLLFASANYRFDRWTGQHGEDVDIVSLIVYCSIIYLLMATQDIAVDGWALTMLRPEMRIHASTCNAAGQYIGTNISYVCLTLLSTQDKSNKLHSARDWLADWTGMGDLALNSGDEIAFRPWTTMSYYIWIFGIIMLVVTLVVFLLHEAEEAPSLMEMRGATELTVLNEGLTSQKFKEIKQSYALLIKIAKLEPAILLGFIILTFNFMYAAESPAELKMLEKGVPKDLLASITPFLIPLQVIGPPFITISMKKSSKTDVIYKGLKMRLIVVISYVGFVCVAGHYYSKTSHNIVESLLFYIPLVALSVCRCVAELVVSVAFVALFADVADPSIGGTYMALLNALANVGQLAPRLIGFWMIDVVESYCRWKADGLLIEGAFCIIVGAIALPIYRNLLLRIESFGTSEWYVNKFADA
ncbi:acetyl-coenzyme A synthetase [Babesia ovis]|uniref:Acetyl-coenzyme A synthetase n=1 Tax=Babesia ovis TaxID=5869 RepID=A0A9W5T9R4_BABOV|nr:acetyl-coenzyme A synthetase [Babesia ovis]